MNPYGGRIQNHMEHRHFPKDRSCPNWLFSVSAFSRRREQNITMKRAIFGGKFPHKIWTLKGVATKNTSNLGVYLRNVRAKFGDFRFTRLNVGEARMSYLMKPETRQVSVSYHKSTFIHNRVSSIEATMTKRTSGTYENDGSSRNFQERIFSKHFENSLKFSVLG